MFFPRNCGLESDSKALESACLQDTVHAKHIRLDMGGLGLDSPILLLDALLSYLRTMQSIDALDIKTKALLPELWPARGDNKDREA